MTFGGGRFLDADGDHLWRVGCKYWLATAIMMTREIAAWQERATRYARTLYIETFSGEFGARTPEIDPYLLGALLGDGCLCGINITFTSMDDDVVGRVDAGLPGMHGLIPASCQNSGAATTYGISTLAPDGELPRNQVKAALRRLGVLGSKSSEKELPGCVFEWPRAARVALLQGLMDTDGTVADGGSIVFGSSSERLVEGMERLVRSLGGKALRQSPKKTTHLDHHRTVVILRDRGEAFSMTRKKDLCTAYTVCSPPADFA